MLALSPRSHHALSSGRHLATLPRTVRVPAFRPTTSPFPGPLVLVVGCGASAGLPSLADVLADGGFAVRTAFMEADAFEQLELFPPDLILLDATLSRSLDAHEMCRRLKMDGRWEHLPVILMSDGVDADTRIRGLAAGAADTLGRAGSTGELLACVQAHARTGRLLRRLEERNAALQREVAHRREHNEHLQRSLDRAIVSGVGDRIKFSTHVAQRLLRRFFPDHPAPDILPPALAAWLADGAHAPWQLTRDGCRLIASLTGSPPAVGRGRPFLLTLEETFLATADAGPARLARLGLTRRETEVLYWIAHGKTNPETGMILQAAPNTIKKHMQNIMLKLGVENRLAAASRALEVIGWS